MEEGAFEDEYDYEGVPYLWLDVSGCAIDNAYVQIPKTEANIEFYYKAKEVRFLLFGNKEWIVNQCPSAELIKSACDKNAGEVYQFTSTSVYFRSFSKILQVINRTACTSSNTEIVWGNFIIA